MLHAGRDVAFIVISIIVLVWTLVQATVYGALYWGLRRFGGRGVSVIRRGLAVTARVAGAIDQMTDRADRAVARPVARLSGWAAWLQAFTRRLRR